LQHVSDGVTVHDADGKLIYANDAAARAGGYASAKALLAASDGGLHARSTVLTEDGQPLDSDECPTLVAFRTGERVVRTLRTRGASGGDERTWEVQAVPQPSETGAPGRVITISRDVTRERETETQLRLRARRQFRIADLGRKALTGMDIPALMSEIVEVVALKLSVPYASILEHRPENRDMIVRAGAGWRTDIIGRTLSDAADASLAGYTLATGAPVMVEDMCRETRVHAPATLREYGIVSGACVPIRNLGRPFGTLAAHIPHHRAFSQDDLYFLESVANILAAAIERREAENVMRESEKRLNMALDAGRMGTWDWNVRTNEVHWSEGIEAIHGVPAGSFGGDFAAYQSDTHPEDRDRVLAAIRQVVEQGGEYSVQYRILPPDGSVKWIEGKGRMMYHDGRPLRLTGICMDISERRRSEEERARLYDEAREAGRRSTFLAEASEALAASLDYETTLNNVARLVVPALADWCAVQVLDRDGRLNQVAVANDDPVESAAGKELFAQFPSDPNATRGVWNVLRTGEAEFVPHLSEELLRSSTPNDDQWEFLRSIGMHSVMLVPMATGDRMVGCISFILAESPRAYTEADFALAKDLARRCAVAIENARLYREVQWADKAKDEFLAMLSHELRNPLGAITNGLALLDAQGGQSARVAEARKLLSRQVGNMSRLLEDLLDVSRSTRGQVHLQRATVDLREIISGAVEAMRGAVDARSHCLTVSLPDDVTPVFADSTRLEQVFCNLLGNAAKYMDNGGCIRLSAEREGDAAVVRVEDTGIGISADLLPHVFELFTQADRSLDRSQGGLGIGLTLVKSLVGLHGGSVAAASAGPGQGSVFTVRLPLSEAEIVPDAPPAETGAPAENGHPRVLVVDDNEDAAETLAAILEMWGCTVKTAHDGPTALASAGEYGPDVVLLDIGLPGMNGYEVARQMRQAEQTQPVLLVAVTGYGRAEDRQAALEAGFAHCLAKPVDLDALKAIVMAPGRP
jgi:PAS domain S-box-containing protein